MMLNYVEAILELPLIDYEEAMAEEERQRQANTEVRLMVLDISEDCYFKVSI